MLSRIFGPFAAVVIASATVQAQSPGKVDLEVASALIVLPSSQLMTK